MDNGQGFNPEDEGDGLGLRSMQERAAILNGEVIIDSTAGQGTRLKCVLPIDPIVEDN